jgi:hypothetical protein
MKYIHTYNTIEEFESDYGDDSPSLVVSFDCELGRFTYVGYNYRPAYIWKNGGVTMVTPQRNVAVGDIANQYDGDGDGIPVFNDEDEWGDEYTHEITSVNGDSFTCDLGTFTYDGVEFYQIPETIFSSHLWRNDDTFVMTQFRNPSVGEECADAEDTTNRYEITAVQTEEHEQAYVEPWVSFTRENESVHYNKAQIIDFQPLGDFSYEDFGITQIVMNRWMNVIDNNEPLENLGVMIMSQPLSRASYDNYGFYFRTLGALRAYVSRESDYVSVTQGDGGHK